MPPGEAASSATARTPQNVFEAARPDEIVNGRHHRQEAQQKDQAKDDKADDRENQGVAIIGPHIGRPETHRQS